MEEEERNATDEERRLLAKLAVPPGLLASRRSVFVRCGLAATDPRFPKYPPLPVRACPGYRSQP